MESYVVVLPTVNLYKKPSKIGTPSFRFFFCLDISKYIKKKMSTPFADLLAASKNNQDNADCDGWRDKLVGKVILNDEEESALGADEVCYFWT